MKLISDLVFSHLTGNAETSFGLLGPGGVGKSDIIKQVAKKLNRPVIEVRAGYMQPGELLGNPKAALKEFTLPNGDIVEYEVTKYTIPEWLQKLLVTPNCILVMEEISNAMPDVMGALYELIWDHRIHDINLPEGTSVIYTGNRAKDAIGIARDLPPTMYTRAMPITIEESDINYNDWREWAIRNNVRADIISFLHDNSNLLLSPQKLGTSYCTPRSWTILSNELDNLYAVIPQEQRTSDNDHFISRVRRLIRSGVPEALELFYAYLINGLSIKQPMEYILGNEKYKRNNELFMQITYNIVDHIYNAQDDIINNIEAFDEFMNNMSDNELTLFTMVATTHVKSLFALHRDIISRLNKYNIKADSVNVRNGNY